MEIVKPATAADAVAALGNGAVALAGGTDLVPMLRDGLARAETLVHLADAVPRGREGTRIGAGTTLAELEADPELPAALREASRLAASPQLRAMGTIGGNLLQATRCWYWRLGFPCYLQGGDTCHAREGEHREHAIFSNELCASAHPSDPAAALLALDATLVTTHAAHPIAALYRLPTADDRSLISLERDEVLTWIEWEPPLASVYLKAMDRRRWAFPIVGVAAARYEGGVRIALSGVAPIPWLLESAAALDDATPLAGTAYKVELARVLVRRALENV